MSSQIIYYSCYPDVLIDAQPAHIVLLVFIDQLHSRPGNGPAAGLLISIQILLLHNLLSTFTDRYR